jgi:hypothetical protein
MRLLTVTRTLHGKAAVAYCTVLYGKARPRRESEYDVRSAPRPPFTSYSINRAFTPHVALLGPGGSKIWDGDARPALSLSLSRYVASVSRGVCPTVLDCRGRDGANDRFVLLFTVSR